MKVNWTPPARRDLQLAVDAIARQDVDLAIGLLDEADRIDQLLQRVPFTGPRLDASNDRKLRLGRLPYIIIYRVKSGALEILRLHHAKADWRP